MSGDTSNEAVSTAEAKDGLGRTLFRRPQKYHQGKRADPTSFEALERAAAGGKQKPPTNLEKELLFGDNPSKVRALKAAGFSDEKIYELLNR